MSGCYSTSNGNLISTISIFDLYFCFPSSSEPFPCNLSPLCAYHLTILSLNITCGHIYVTFAILKVRGHTPTSIWSLLVTAGRIITWELTMCPSSLTQFPRDIWEPQLIKNNMFYYGNHINILDMFYSANVGIKLSILIYVDHVLSSI